MSLFSQRVRIKKNYRLLLDEYKTLHNKELKPIHFRSKSIAPDKAVCPSCQAPHNYLYFNDGKKKSQLKCKVCHLLFQLNKRFRNKPKYYCPHCQHSLFKWKERAEVTIYKCGNDNCSHRLKALDKLNASEKNIRQQRLSQFKLCYQYREYHFEPAQLQQSKPLAPTVNLSKIHNTENVVGLILAFHISFAITARKTAFIMKSVFNIKVSYQTVLNYAESAAYHCHQFNLQNKGPVDDMLPGDETYIKIIGKNNYVFFFISAKSLKIAAYHIADSRETLPAVIAMNEAIRTAQPDQKVTIISDGNPSYPAGIHFINASSDPDNPLIHNHRKVIGLQNLDSESEEFRPFKQLIERLNRTFKHHVRPACGFNSFNGAVAMTTLFVTHYNFLRPHMSLNYKPPIHAPDLDRISTIQGKWAKILALAA